MKTAKQLLYYESYKRMSKHYNGTPIYNFKFKNVKTGANVSLGVCYYNEEVSNIVGGRYYKQIEDATNDFDILWNLTEEKISPISESFINVRLDYQTMLRQGLSEKEINEAIIKKYQKNSKIKIFTKK